MQITQVKQMNELTEEQKRIIEENRRKAMERKRKREEAESLAKGGIEDYQD